MAFKAHGSTAIGENLIPGNIIVLAFGTLWCLVHFGTSSRSMLTYITVPLSLLLYQFEFSLSLLSR